jgi:hypothetical protein
MDLKLASIFLLSQELGGFNKDTLEDRIFIQKAIYLIQLLGVDLRYRFSWYHRGPFSFDLSDVVYQIYGERMSEETKELKVSPDIQPAINEINGLVAKKPYNLHKGEWLELLSSIHYLKWIAGIGMSSATAAAYLAEVGKSQFTEAEVTLAWECLHNVGLIENKTRDLIRDGSR